MMHIYSNTKILMWKICERQGKIHSDTEKHIQDPSQDQRWK